MIVDEMKAYYARRAPIYDQSMGYHRAETVKALKPVLEFLSERLQGRRILELACGTGFWTGRVSRSARSAVAIDYNLSMLAQCLQRPDRERSVPLLAADVYSLPFASGSFNGAFAVDWFAHVPLDGMQSFLKGLHATLAAGAEVVFCDQLPGPQSRGRRDAQGNHIQERVLPDGSMFRVIKHYFSDEELESILGPHAAGGARIERFPEVRRMIVSYSLACDRPG